MANPQYLPLEVIDSISLFIAGGFPVVLDPIMSVFLFLSNDAGVGLSIHPKLP